MTKTMAVSGRKFGCLMDSCLGVRPRLSPAITAMLPTMRNSRSAGIAVKLFDLPSARIRPSAIRAPTAKALTTCSGLRFEASSKEPPKCLEAIRVHVLNERENLQRVGPELHKRGHPPNLRGLGSIRKSMPDE